MSSRNGIPEANINPRKWHSSLSREERVTICRHFIYKLASFYGGNPEALLKERTRTFEALTFNSSASRDEYLKSIANCLTKIEEWVSAKAKAAQQQVSNPQIPSQANVNPTKWHSSMSREERVIICRHFMCKLASFYRDASEATLKERTRTFEALTFNSSASRDEYLKSIANCLAKIEERVSAKAKAAQQQVSNPQLPSQANVNPTKWHSSMSREERVIICRHFMCKLASFYRDASEATLKEQTRTFEAHAFNSSASRDDYLNSIANRLAKIEEWVSAEASAAQQQLPNQQLPNPQQISQQPSAQPP